MVEEKREVATFPSAETQAASEASRASPSSPASSDDNEYELVQVDWRIAVGLFLATAASTFWAGVNHWLPLSIPLSQFRQLVIAHWLDGLIYMLAVMSFLLAHEMGHFLATVYYKVPATYPLFLPFPIAPFGTFGAVIDMDARRPDRRQMFDIGIAGPVAGLVVAIPVTCIGLSQLNMTTSQQGPYLLDIPLVLRWALAHGGFTGYEPGQYLAFNQVNPWLMAGWLGLLVTGLNMIPIGQFDGGHVTYTMFGKPARWFARILLVGIITYGVYFQAYNLLLLTTMFIIVGPDHPDTSDDQVPLGVGRMFLGWVCLTLPILCVPPALVVLVTH